MKDPERGAAFLRLFAEVGKIIGKAAESEGAGTGKGMQTVFYAPAHDPLAEPSTRGTRRWSISEIPVYAYLEQQVTQKARSVGGNQHPVTKGGLEGVLLLIKVGK